MCSHQERTSTGTQPDSSGTDTPAQERWNCCAACPLARFHTLQDQHTLTNNEPSQGSDTAPSHHLFLLDNSSQWIWQPQGLTSTQHQTNSKFFVNVLVKCSKLPEMQNSSLTKKVFYFEVVFFLPALPQGSGMELEGNCCAPVSLVLASELTIGTCFYHATVEVKKQLYCSRGNLKLICLYPQLERLKFYTGSIRTAQLRSSNMLI